MTKREFKRLKDSIKEIYAVDGVNLIHEDEISMIIEINRGMVQSGRDLFCKCMGYGAKIDYKEETEFTTYTIEYRDTLCRTELDFLSDCGIPEFNHNREVLDALAQYINQLKMYRYEIKEKQ